MNRVAATGRHVALLRGINVGKAKRIAMADLRRVVAALGYEDVLTLLNSGNVVFTVPPGVRGDHATRIEDAIVTRIGVTSRVTVLSGAELVTIVDDNPLAKQADDPSRLLVTVLTDPALRPTLQVLAKQRWAPEAFGLGKRATYAWCPKGMTDSPLASAIAKLIGDGGTTRNWATITKLHALVRE
jgi:uncharacterized protein (DUF1697 family)